MHAIEDELVDKFAELAKVDIEMALQISTGIFVALNVAYANHRGKPGDGDKQITIEGPAGQRKITIHAA